MRRTSLTLLALVYSTTTYAGLDLMPAPPPDLSSYATQSDLNAAISASTITKSDTIPTTAPGAGKCKFTWVSSNLVQSGGVTGAAGKCSRIVQCGTSVTYVVQLFDIGDGC